MRCSRIFALYRLRKNRLDEAALCQGIALAGLMRVALVLRGQRLFELEVPLRHLRMCAQVIAKREMPGFLHSASFAKVNMVRAWPLGRFLEEGIDAIELTKRDVPIPERLEDANIGPERVEGIDRDLDVDHGLCSKPGHRRGAHMLHARCEIAKRASYLTSLRLEHVGPRGIVRDEGDQVTDPS